MLLQNVIKKRLELKIALIMGVFMGGARLSQGHIRESATILLVNIKNWDFWATSEGERDERALFTVVARFTHFRKPFVNLDPCTQSNCNQDFLEA